MGIWKDPETRTKDSQESTKTGVLFPAVLGGGKEWGKGIGHGLEVWMKPWPWSTLTVASRDPITKDLTEPCPMPKSWKYGTDRCCLKPLTWG